MRHDEPVATYTYDADGNLLTATDGDGHTTTYTYNALNEQTVGRPTPTATPPAYTYDGDGRVLTVTDGLGHTTTYTYDAMGDVLTETQPSGGGTTTYTYDAAGDLLTRRGPGRQRHHATPTTRPTRWRPRRCPTGGVTPIRMTSSAT